MVYRDPDQIGRRYVELGSTLADIKAIDIVATKGEVCIHCGGPSTLIKRGRVDTPGRWQWVLVCTCCREPWVSESYEIMRRWCQEAPATNTQERSVVHRIDEWRMIRPIIETPARKDSRGIRFVPGRWRFSVASWLIYLQPWAASYDHVVDYGSQNLTEYEELWTPKRCRDAIRKVRGVVRARGIAAKVLNEALVH